MQWKLTYRDLPWFGRLRFWQGQVEQAVLKFSADLSAVDLIAMAQCELKRRARSLAIERGPFGRRIPGSPAENPDFTLLRGNFETVFCHARQLDDGFKSMVALAQSVDGFDPRFVGLIRGHARRATE